MAEPETIDDYKKVITRIEIQCKTDHHPLDALNWIRQQLELDNADERYLYFMANSLANCVDYLLLRSDYTDPSVRAVVALLNDITMHCSVRIGKYDFAPRVLLAVFDLSKRPKFYQQYGMENDRVSYDEELEESDDDMYLNREWRLSRHVLHCVKLFLMNGSHMKVIDAFETCYKTKEDKIPFAMLRLYLRLVERIHDVIEEAIANELILNTVKASTAAVLRMPNEEVKLIDRKHILDMLQDLKTILIRLYGKKSLKPHMYCEKFQLDVALQWLQLPFITKRVIGLGDINDFCQQLLSPMHHSRDIYYYDSKSMIEWLGENKVVEYLFGESSHPELIKRARPTLRFFALRGDMHMGHLDLIWEASNGKHESIVHEVWSLLSYLSTSFDLPLVSHIFDKIKTIPANCFDAQYVDFLKEITERALNLSLAESDLDVKMRKWYGIETLWDGLETNRFPPTLTSHVMNTFLNFMDGFPCRKLRYLYLAKVVDNIRQGRLLVNSMQALHYILGTFNTAIDVGSCKIILSLNIEHNLVQLVHTTITNITSEKVKKSIQDQGLGENDIDYTNLVDPNYGYLFTLRTVFELMDFLLSQSPLELSEEQVFAIWDATVVNAVTLASRDIAYDWFRTSTRSAEKPFPSFNDAVTRAIFLAKIPALDFPSLTPAGASLIDHLFKYLNSATNDMPLIVVDDIFTVCGQNFIGLDYLWRLAIETQNQSVGDGAIDLLTRLQQHVHLTNDSDFLPLREAYLSRIMEYLGRYSTLFLKDQKDSDKLALTRTLVILKKFLDLFEDRKCEKHGVSVARGRWLTLTINTSSHDTFPVVIYDRSTVRDLKVKIAEHLKRTDITPLKLSVNGTKLDDETKRLQEYPVGDNIISLEIDSSHERREEALKGVSAVTLLSSELYFRQLFKLLSLPSPICLDVWDIIMRIPTNSQMKLALTNIKEDTKWDELLSTENCFSLFYTLQILDSLAYIDAQDAEAARQAKAAFHEQFIKCQGLQSLFGILQTLNFFDNKLGSKRYQCFALLLRILNYFLLEILPPPLPLTPPTSTPTGKERQSESSAAVTSAEGQATTSTSATSTPRQGATQSQALTQKSSGPGTVAAVVASTSGTTLPIKLRIDLVKNLKIDIQEFTFKLLNIIKDISDGGNIRQSQQYDQSSKKGVQDFEVNETVATLSLSLLVGFLTSFKEAMDFFVHYSDLGTWLETILITTSLTSLKSLVAERLLEITQSDAAASSDISSIFFSYLYTSISKIKANTRSYRFFLLFSGLVRNKNFDSDAEVSKLLEYFCQSIAAHPIIEMTSHSHEDEMMMGLMEVVKTILARFPHLKLKFGSFLIEEIFVKNLFDIPSIATLSSASPSTLSPPRCKTASSRRVAFSLLIELCRDNIENLVDLSERTMKIQLAQNYQHSWNYFPLLQEKCNGYVGLENLGATCYMNSLLQQLYMNQCFRSRLLAVDSKFNTDEESVLFQLKTIFIKLSESEKSAYNPRSFCKVYKVDGEPMKTGIQMDVDEFLNMLFDRIDGFVKDTSQSKLLTDVFGGEVVNQIISLECEHKVERKEPFFTIAIEVKGKNSVHESLDLFIQSDMLEGDNKYECTNCKAFVTAKKRCCVNTLPNNLILHMKRFDFDLEYLQRSKITDYVEFPMKLNLEPYTKEGLERKESNSQSPPLHPPEYYEYNLCGVLIHTGMTTDSGHYYSFIKDRATGTWLKFNDETVSSFNVDNHPEQWFGGDYTSSVWDTHFGKYMSKTSTRPNSAYMLFYERLQQNELVAPEVIPSKPKIVDTCRNIYEKIWEENQKFIVDKNLFDSNYTHFILSLTALAALDDSVEISLVEDIDNYERDQSMKVVELAITFLMRTLSHAKNKESVAQLVDYILKVLNKHIPLCQWLITKLTGDSDWVREIFLWCDDRKAGQEVARLIMGALAKLLPFETEALLASEAEERMVPERKNTKKDNIDFPFAFIPPIPLRTKSYIKNLLNSLLLLSTTDARGSWRTFEAFWGLFEGIAKLNDYVRHYMLKKGFLRCLLHYYLQDESPYFEGQREVRKSTDRTPNELTTLANMKHILGTVAVLVTACTVDRQSESTVPSPVSIEPPPTHPLHQQITLAGEDLKILLSNRLFVRLISDGTNIDAMQAIVAHLAWENEVLSYNLIDQICQGINADSNDRFPPYWPVFRCLLFLEDSLSQKRMLYGMEKFMDVLLKNLKYPLATTACLPFLLSLVTTSHWAREYLFNNRGWLKPFLLYSKMDGDQIRIYTEKIVLELVPEVRTYFTKIPASSYGHTNYNTVLNGEEVDEENVYPDQAVSDTTRERLHIVQNELMTILKDVNMVKSMVIAEPMMRGDDERDIPPKDAFKLCSLFRLLEWTLISPVEKAIFLRDKTCLNVCIILYENTEMRKQENDYNKLYYFKFFDRLSTDHIEGVHWLTQQVNFFGLWISLRFAQIGFNYINRALYYYYSVLYKCCLYSRSYSDTFASHSNFVWGFTFLHIKDSMNYKRAAHYMLKMFEHFWAQDPEFQFLWVTKFLKIGHDKRDDLGNWRMLYPTVTNLLQRGRALQLTFCRTGGLDHLVDALMRRDMNHNHHAYHQDMLELLTCLDQSIAWFSDCTEKEMHLLDQILEQKRKKIVGHLVSLLATVGNESQEIGDLAHTILNRFGYVCNQSLIYIIEKSLNQQKSFPPPNFTPTNTTWLSKHYIFLSNIAEKTVNLCLENEQNNQPQIFELLAEFIFVLALNSLKLMNHPVTARFLHLILLLPEESVTDKPEFLIDLYSKLCKFYHLMHINDDDHIMLTFVNQYSSMISPFLTEDITEDMKVNFHKFVDHMMNDLLSGDPLFDHPLLAIISAVHAFEFSIHESPELKEKLIRLDKLVMKEGNEDTIAKWKTIFVLNSQQNQ